MLREDGGKRKTKENRMTHALVRPEGSYNRTRHKYNDVLGTVAELVHVGTYLQYLYTELYTRRNPLSLTRPDGVTDRPAIMY